MDAQRLSSVDTSTTSYMSSTSDNSSDEGSSSQNENDSHKRKNESFDDCFDERSKLPRMDPGYNESYYGRGSDDNEKASPSFESLPDFSYGKPYKSDEDSEHDSDKNSFSQNNQTNAGQDKVSLMMKKMGYSAGKGLGKRGQGIVEPITASTQKGRRGLGWELEDFKQVSLEFRPEDEIVEVEEKITWLENKHSQMISDNDLLYWKSERKEGPRKETIDGETIFCDETIVKGIIDSKSMFDRLDKNEMREARTRSNPFETIRGAIFLNRAAVKMANMDRACNFMFTEAEKYLKDDLLYFADVCAGPGGFSEYVLWRKNWRAKGFGFTLKASNDFKLEDFLAGSPNTFHPYYGPMDDGDVYNPVNQEALRDLIMSQTDNKGVHFMMADGGFSVEGQENIQEILSKQLYLCQCLVALMIVRAGGHFVTKLFDLFTPFSAGLVYIMHRCFKRVSIFKPNTSRPANSERYLICEGKRSDINHVIDYLFKINKTLSKNNLEKDVLEIVPIEVLISDKNFFDYLKNSNEELGHRQIIGLKKIATYTESRTLIDERQNIMRKECLKYWKVPDEYRVLPRKSEAKIRAQELLQLSMSILQKMGNEHCTKLTKENIVQTVLSGSPFDYFCIPSSAGEYVDNDPEPTLYLSMERSNVYRYDRKYSSWKKVDFIELPCNTLVYAELITEFRNEDQRQMKTSVLHILDAFTLGKLNISDRFFTDRNRLIKLFCKALWKPDACLPKDQTPAIRVRAKELISLNEVEHKLKLVPKLMKRGRERKAAFLIKTYPYENCKDDYFYIPKNILFFRITEKPWHYGFSQKEQNFYFNNPETRKSQWASDFIPPQAVSKFSKTLENRILWNWPFDNSFNLDHFLEIKQNHESKR